MDKNIPINKGNYHMDTEERLQLFEKKKATGWEEEYYEYRRNWAEYPKRQFVAEYPLLVDIELSSVCNLKCPMCYMITEDFKSKVRIQLMEMDLFKKIVDEISGKVQAVRLSLRGEATLHPEFTKCICYCKQRGIKEVSFLTNASKLTREYFIEIAKAGADWITISIDGTGETYEQVRKPLKFADTLQKVKDIYYIKRENGWEKPVIKIQGIWPSIKNNPGQYYDTFAPYTDLVAFNPLIDYLGNDEDIVYEDNFSCPQLYQRLVIGSDGKVLLCSNDEEGRYLLGDVNTESIHAIWHGERMDKARQIHKDGGFARMDVCRKCYIPRKTEDHEHARVGDREFVIKNYVNRGQVIGE